MNFRRLMLFITFLAIFTMAVRVSIDTDTWWHLRAGSWMLENRQILRQDPFSLTRLGEAWVYPGWLAQILLFGVFRLAGFGGLNVFTAAMVVIAFSFVWRLMEAPTIWRSFIILLAVTVSGVYWAARPHIFSFALAAGFYWLLEGARKGRLGCLWPLPVLMALWVNIHGGFAIGFILLSAYLASELIEWVTSAKLRIAMIRTGWEARSRRILGLGAISVACVLGTGLNPHGFAMLGYPFRTISIGVLRDFIQEWQSPDFHQLYVQPFLWMLLLILISFALSHRRVEPIEIILVTGFAYMGMMAGRNIALFGLVAAPPLARHAHSALEPILAGKLRENAMPSRTTKYINTFIFLVLLFAAGVKISIPLSDQVNQEAIGSQVPVGAVNYIRQERPEGPLFNSYNWGGYVLWALYPEYLSFVDGRTDLFSDQILIEYLRIWRAEDGWRELLDQWGIQLVLIEPESPLASALQREGWIELYSDKLASVYAPAADL